MAAELKKAFSADSQLNQLSGGIFDVYVDDKLVFSKHQTGRFPEEGEIVKMLAAKKS